VAHPPDMNFTVLDMFILIHRMRSLSLTKAVTNCLNSSLCVHQFPYDRPDSSNASSTV
jgi:hypothetical protein